MPTGTTVIEQIIDPVPEDVAEIEALEGNVVHISGVETITGRKTFTNYVTAPEFRGTLRGDIVAGRLTGPLDLNGYPLTGLTGLGFEELANKGAVNGYAPLGATGLVPAANLGTGGAGAGDNFLADDGQFRPISAGSVSFGTQAANLVFAGPGSGSAAAPAFRLMVAADIPTLPQSKITDLVTDLLSKVPTTRTITEGAGLAGNTYDLSANRTLAMGTPASLAVDSVNSASGTTHSHAITSSSNPGAAAKLLATDGSGFLTIPRLTLTDRLLINALTANLFLKDTSTGFQAATTGIITPQPTNIWRNTTYTSGVRGWNIPDDDADVTEFSNLRARGSFYASVFAVSEVSATAGTLGVFKSASTVAADFTTPASTGSSFDFNAKNSDAGAMLFAVNDIIRFKTWTGSGISDAWATVTARVDHTTYTTYTATLESGSTSATFRSGTAAIDYGPSGTGFITLSADGTVGSSPNMTMATHAGSPWSAQTTLLRAGNLNGSYGYTTNVYGFGIGQYGAAQSWLTFDTTNGIRLGNNTNVLGQWDASGNVTFGLVAPGSRNIYIPFGDNMQFRSNVTSFLTISGGGVIVGQDGVDSNITIDTTNGLRIRDNTTVRLHLALDGSGYLANSLIAWDTSGNLTVSGNATIGGFSIGSDYIRDNGNSFGLASTVTGGDDVRFWAGNTFANRGSAPFRLTESGALVATSATISGAITATSGSFTGAITATSGTFGAVANNQANMHWNASNQRLEFRGSTNGTVVQSYIDTDGSFNAGPVKLRSSGLSITAPASPFASTSAITWNSSGTEVGGLYNASNGTTNTDTRLDAISASGVTRLLVSSGPTGHSIRIFAGDGILPAPYFLTGVTIGLNLAPAHMLDVYGTGWFQGNLSANSASSQMQAYPFSVSVGSDRNIKVQGGFLTTSALRITAVNNADTVLIPLELLGAPVIISQGGLNVGGIADPGINKFAIANSHTPASAAASGVTGTIAWDANFIYVATATNTWKRAAIATW